MSEALTQVIRMYPGWTMFCIVIAVICVASGVEGFLLNLARRRK